LPATPREWERMPPKQGAQKTTVWTEVMPNNAPPTLPTTMASRQPFKSAQQLKMHQEPLQLILHDIEEHSDDVPELTPMMPPNTPVISVAATIQLLPDNLLTGILPPAYSISSTGCVYEASSIMQVPVPGVKDLNITTIELLQICSFGMFTYQHYLLFLPCLLWKMSLNSGGCARRAKYPNRHGIRYMIGSCKCPQFKG
jgi:hypothetical protein